MNNIKRVITILMSAISNCSLYSKEHASVDELIKRLLSILNDLFLENEMVEIMIIEDEIVINKSPVKDTGIHGVNLIKRFKRKGISRVDFLRGIKSVELNLFVSDITDQQRPVRSYPHIKPGTVTVDIDFSRIVKDTEGMFSDAEEISRLSNEQVEKLKEVYFGLSPFKRLNTAGLDDIVLNFILAFRKKLNLLNLLSSFKGEGEYTYTHATNVAALSIFQAGSLGMAEELLHDMGIASLLHDVGKLFISQEILSKEGELNPDEWRELQNHTLYGARYLAKTDGLTRLAPVVALEHHLGYDGQGYPVLKTKKEKQHLSSQIVAISDFFDIMRSRRLQGRDWQTEDVLLLMRENAWTRFNPFLVDNFSRIVVTALKG